MIKLRNFFKSFGPKNVLRSLDLDVESGEIVTIRGKNGSGKTTLLKALSTLEKPLLQALTSSVTRKAFRRRLEIISFSPNIIHTFALLQICVENQQFH